MEHNASKSFRINLNNSEIRTCAYHCDGNAYPGEDAPLLYAAPFKDKDVIGCGLIIKTGQIFFTRNGEFLGTIASVNTGSPYSLFPTIQLGELQTAKFNYGSKKFLFDLKKKHYKKVLPKASHQFLANVGLFANDMPLPLKSGMVTE